MTHTCSDRAKTNKVFRHNTSLTNCTIRGTHILLNIRALLLSRRHRLCSCVRVSADKLHESCLELWRRIVAPQGFPCGPRMLVGGLRFPGKVRAEWNSRGDAIMSGEREEPNQGTNICSQRICQELVHQPHSMREGGHRGD